MASTDDTRAYLTGQLDQLAAAAHAGDQDAQDATAADLITDDRPDARQVIADALRLRAARDATATTQEHS
jgi:hypothetical protein